MKRALGLAIVLTGLVATPLPAQERNPHRELGGRDCAGCHTTSGWTSVSFNHAATRFPLTGRHVVAPCTGCHDLRDFRGATAECRACHQDPHRGDAGASCEQCHTPNGWTQVLAADAHARTRLPDLGVHASLPCADCHRSTGVQPFTAAVAACVTCHRPAYAATQNPSHAALGLGTRCDECHQLAVWRPALFARHDAVFGIYRGEHAGSWRSCATCHPVASDYRVYTCTTCHANGPTTREHEGIPGYGWESTACLGCHPGGTRSGDLSFHVPLFPLFAGPHAGQWTACSQCHTSPADRSVISCVAGCHAQPGTDAFHQSIPGYAYQTAQCRTCHPDGRAGTFAGHDAIFPIFAGPHNGTWQDCAACHTDPASRGVFTCTGGGCHVQATTNTRHARIPGYAYVSAQCLSCHPDGRAGTFAQHDVVWAIYAGPHAGAWSGCEQCHTAPGDRTVISCLTTGCHAPAPANTFHLSMTGYGYTSTQCRTCHPDGRRGRYTAHDPRFPIYAGTHSGRWTSCTTCHTDPASRTVFTCLASGCHAQAATNAVHTGFPGYAWQSSTCFGCHPDGTAGSFTQHDAIFPVFSGKHREAWTSCTSCHPVAEDRRQFTCMGTGCHAQSSTNADHEEVSGYQFVAAACLTCHPRGEN